MPKLSLISSSEELARFLFGQMRVRWRVSERPILTMHTVFDRRFDRKPWVVPVWLWTITIFLADEAEQPIAGRTLTVFHRSDAKPDEETLIGLFTDYSFYGSQIWDTDHSRCYGYFRWRSISGNSSRDEEAMEDYKREKAIVLAVRALLGARGFGQLIRAEL